MGVWALLVLYFFTVTYTTPDTRINCYFKEIHNEHYFIARDWSYHCSSCDLHYVSRQPLHQDCKCSGERNIIVTDNDYYVVTCNKDQLEKTNDAALNMFSWDKTSNPNRVQVRSSDKSIADTLYRRLVEQKMTAFKNWI